MSKLSRLLERQKNKKIVADVKAQERLLEPFIRAEQRAKEIYERGFLDGCNEAKKQIADAAANKAMAEEVANNPSKVLVEAPVQLVS